MTAGSNWQPAIRRDTLSDDGMHAAVVGEHRLVVLVADGEVIAYRDACPHEGFPLSKFAERQDFVIVCSKHLWEFETGTGEHISRIPRPQCNLTRYPTREVDGMVEVDIGAVPGVEPPTAARAA